MLNCGSVCNGPFSLGSYYGGLTSGQLWPSYSLGSISGMGTWSGLGSLTGANIPCIDRFPWSEGSALLSIQPPPSLVAVPVPILRLLQSLKQYLFQLGLQEWVSKGSPLCVMGNFGEDMEGSVFMRFWEGMGRGFCPSVAGVIVFVFTWTVNNLIGKTRWQFRTLNVTCWALGLPSTHNLLFLLNAADGSSVPLKTGLVTPLLLLLLWTPCSQYFLHCFLCIQPSTHKHCFVMLLIAGEISLPCFLLANV